MPRHTARSSALVLALALALPAGALGLTRGEVKSKHIAKNAVKAKQLAPRSVKAGKLAPNAVRTPKIAAGAVTMPKLADDAVTSAKVADGSLTAADLDLATMPFWRLGGNAGTNPATDFIGTTSNTSLHVRVNNQRVLRIDPGGIHGSPNVIAGHQSNASVGSGGSTIGGGGGASGNANTAGTQATVGGGVQNHAGGDGATVSGGATNGAPGNYSIIGGGVSNSASHFATIAGGGSNTAGHSATVGGGSFNSADDGGTVAGGAGNTASGSRSTVAGGGSNTASGSFAAVAGGVDNIAAGSYSFVAGRRARNVNPTNPGVFVFADSTNADFNAAASNEFAVRASGGVRLRTSSNLSTGCQLPSGSGTWECTSDRATKRGFEAVDGESVLARLGALPIATWTYKADETAARHIGPTAQDFHAAFGLGSDARTISSVDADGVALAAIKALSERNGALARRVARLSARIDELERRPRAPKRGGRR